MTVSPERVEIIVEKAEFVDRCIEILAERQSVDREAYAERIEIKDVVERRFETMTQACIDIARILLKELGVAVPDPNPDTMRRLATEGVLSSPTGESMAEACGLRNVLAHEYGEVIDDDVVYEVLQDLSRYRAFLAEIRNFPTSHEAI
jgi:uncharacterized protein YutE (UPF0331/DUF86 family)